MHSDWHRIVSWRWKCYANECRRERWRTQYRWRSWCEQDRRRCPTSSQENGLIRELLSFELSLDRSCCRTVACSKVSLQIDISSRAMESKQKRQAVSFLSINRRLGIVNMRKPFYACYPEQRWWIWCCLVLHRAAIVALFDMVLLGAAPSCHSGAGRYVVLGASRSCLGVNFCIGTALSDLQFNIIARYWSAVLSIHAQ